jgi:hypothetical protein
MWTIIERYRCDFGGGRWVVAKVEGPGSYDDTFPSLRGVFAWARERRFDYVRFDCDSDLIEGLPHYDW